MGRYDRRHESSFRSGLGFGLGFYLGASLIRVAIGLVLLGITLAALGRLLNALIGSR